jgi:hypothetical protein
MPPIAFLIERKEIVTTKLAAHYRGARRSRAGEGRAGKRKGPRYRGPSVLSWGYVDLNHGPLPYQGSALTD